MTDIVPVPNWGGVRQLETNEYATGGLNGNMNEQAKSLAGQNMYSRLYAGLPFDPVFTAQVGGFPIGGKAALENGDIVRSTVANNIVDPNLDMTGWINESKKIKLITSYGARRGISYASDVAFSEAVADCKDGDTLIIDGDFYLEQNWDVSKNINIECWGDIYLHGDNNNSIVFSSPIHKEITGSDLLDMPHKSDVQLKLKPAIIAELGNLSDYFISIRSNEKLVNRLGYTESEAYKKGESNFFTHSDGSLANGLYLTYTDSLAFYARIYKKSRPCIIENLVPKIKSGTFTGTSRNSLVIVQGRSNILWVNCGFDKTNAESTGGGFTIIDSTLMQWDSPQAKKWNKTGADSYAFLSNYSSYLEFNFPKTEHTEDAKRDRFYSSRHSSKIVFNNLVGSFDEHWGYDYTLNNYVSTKDSRITFSGGDLTINNVDSTKVDTGAIIFTRTDTPYCNGTLRLNGGKTKGCILYDYLDVTAINAAFTRKCFDRIILEGGIEVYDSGELPIFALRNYETLANITHEKTSIILRDVVYTRKADANTNGGLITGQGNLKSILSLTIDNLSKKVDGVDTLPTKYPLIKNIYADSLNVLISDKFTFQDLFVDKLDVIGGSIGDEKLGFYNLSVTDYARFTSTTLNESLSQYSVLDGIVDKIFYVGCNFKTSYLLTNATLAAAIAGAYANSFDNSIANNLFNLAIDIANYTNQTRVRNLRGTYTIPANVTVPANGISSVYPPSSNISLNGARIGDIIGAGLTGGTGIEVVPSCAVNGTVNFYLKNNSGADITVSSGSIVKFKVL